MARGEEKGEDWHLVRRFHQEPRFAMLGGVVRSRLPALSLPLRTAMQPQHTILRTFSTSIALRQEDEPESDFEKSLQQFQKSNSAFRSSTRSPDPVRAQPSTPSGTGIAAVPPPLPSSSAGASKDGDAGSNREATAVDLSWESVLSSIGGSYDASTSFPDTRGHYVPALTTSEKQELDLDVEFEELWKRRRPRNEPYLPAKPSEGRTVTHGTNIDYAKSVTLMNSILARNNVKQELRLGERYEKPNQKRRRLRSERHRRRFADAVKQKVQLIMELKARGA